MLTQDQIQRYHRDGFTRSDRLIDPDRISGLIGELERVIRDQGSATPQPERISNLTGDPARPLWQIVNIWQASTLFHDLVTDGVLAACAASLLGGDDVRLWHDQIQYKPAQKGGVNMWHQDLPYWPVLTPDSELTAWIALDDADADNGCMCMVPGSHRWGNHIRFLEQRESFFAMPKTLEGHEIEVRHCPVAAGEVHFHHSMTWHGSPANPSGRHRRAIAIHYMSAKTRFSTAGDHLLRPAIESANDEPVRGAPFLMVWQDGRPVAGTSLAV